MSAPPVASFDTAYELEHRYTRESGRVYLTGVQALVRLPLMQRVRDEMAGLRTAGFISGYRGSPLGVYDMALWQARELLEAARVRFEPGLNEDLAATAVWGSQQAAVQPGPKFDGVFGIWYGKGPGVDRSCDPIKHGNYMGTDARGGVLALLGDDPAARSSSIAHQSEYAMVHCGVPVLNPANVQEFLDLGLHGFALSRFSGCWVGFKCLTDTVDSAASVNVNAARVQPVTSNIFEFPDGADHHISMHNRLVATEEQLYQVKLPAAQAYVRANKLDRVLPLSAPKRQRRLGIITTGKASLDVLQALNNLGVDEARAAQLGLAVYKVALSWPLDPVGAREFCSGLREVLVVEEKRPLVEEQLARILYNERERPRLLGKRDLQGATLVPAAGELAPDLVAVALARWLKTQAGGDDAQLALTATAATARAARVLATRERALSRLPAFCAGCPHSASTVVPEGSRALGGIGCHGMAVWMPERNTFGATQMGGEGANWIGQAPFIEMPHVFQNMGDGTYFHSGLLSVRACVAAQVNITFKILVNGAVAMTGGQPIEGEAFEGEITTPEIVRQLLAEGVGRVAVATNEPEKYAAGAFPREVRVHHRDALLRVQRELRETPGVSALVYDQTCAAEARRLRKSGQLPEPDARIVINELLCEGCGDCSVQSNCIAIEPVETTFGRKRRINQSACNKDYSCLKGYCPSFVTVSGARLRKRSEGVLQGEAIFGALPTPAPLALGKPVNVLIAGIGGTGVVTLGAILSMAAHLEGRGVSELDVTGLAQKNGPVASHVRVAENPDAIFGARIGAGGADLVLACDPVVATNAEHLPLLAPHASVVLNTHVTPTFEFATNADLDLSSEPMLAAARAMCSDGNVLPVDANALARALLGDAVYANMFLLGVAFQRGRLPVSERALLRAIELNGREVAKNQRALDWGRLFAHDSDAVTGFLRADASTNASAVTGTSALQNLVNERERFLRAYQSPRFARRYRNFVARAAEREREVCGAGDTDTDGGALACAVARYYFKLLAIKDEFETARLYTDGSFEAQLAREFEGDYKISLHLASDHLLTPLFARKGEDGRAKKIALSGKIILPVFRVMARFKFLRGTPFNPFGYRAHRKLERELVRAYERDIEEVLEKLTPEAHATGVQLASLPEQVRGFDMVKEQHLSTMRDKRRELFDSFRRLARPRV